MKRKLLLFTILIAMVSCKQKQETVTKEVTNIKIKIQTVQTASGLLNLRYSGTVEASQTIPLSFQSSGTVDLVLVQEGDAVRKGQLLASINKANNQSIYNSSQAMYEQAKDAYDRLKQVHDNGSLPDIKWVEMETNLKKAESQLEVAKSSLDKCNLYAPTNGIVGKRDIEPGQSSMTSLSPIELVKIETILVKISVPENEIDKIRKGMDANFTISAIGNKHFKGSVTHVGVVADQFSRTYEVKISANNPNLEIKPGMVCDVLLSSATMDETIIIPYTAVTKDTDGHSFVFVVSPDQKSVKKQIITLGNYQTNGLEVLSGLTANQTIVVEGKEKLSDNSQIIL